MKRLLLAVGIAAVTVGSVAAADLPAGYAPRAPAYVPFFTWNGFYLGLNAGYGFGRSDWTDTVFQVSTGRFDVNGGLIGGTAGYNAQSGGWVLGLEADVGWSNIKGSTTTNCLVTCQTSNDWLGTGRARAGYAFDRFLPYLTGGVAFGGVKANVTGFGAFSDTGVGWTGGGGIEYAFANNWSAKIEYLYVDLGRTTCNAICSGTNPFDVTFTASIVRGGVNYKF